jgi:hypothetical protein
MEMIVVFNQGYKAAKAGEPRVAPESIQYPIIHYVTKQITHYEKALLDRMSKQVWLQGFDKWENANAA